ncbi:hypothetical protein QNH39_12790 [Neobacillus novalis]|uniref:Uncharacterized protein n=1 Tax=Neobacillus novalis TaxID=220687 RepID=A0AA95SAZ5_9BACI|nr:hypothetical protein [Neobacillus novalis]WHY88650.1 hypothetical protein QNH39_12790 [Neobacillus novalis]
MKRVVTACFIPCLFALLVCCTSNQDSQSATKSPPRQSTPSPDPNPSTSNQNQQNNEPKNPANNQSNPQ